MSGYKRIGGGKHANRKRIAKAGEVGKPFPPPGGYYIQWYVTPQDGGHVKFYNSTK